MATKKAASEFSLDLRAVVADKRTKTVNTNKIRDGNYLTKAQKHKDPYIFISKHTVSAFCKLRK